MESIRKVRQFPDQCGYRLEVQAGFLRPLLPLRPSGEQRGGEGPKTGAWEARVLVWLGVFRAKISEKSSLKHLEPHKPLKKL